MKLFKSQLLHESTARAGACRAPRYGARYRRRRREAAISLACPRLLQLGREQVVQGEAANADIHRVA